MNINWEGWLYIKKACPSGTERVRREPPSHLGGRGGLSRSLLAPSQGQLHFCICFCLKLFNYLKVGRLVSRVTFAAIFLKPLSWPVSRVSAARVLKTRGSQAGVHVKLTR